MIKITKIITRLSKYPSLILITILGLFIALVVFPLVSDQRKGSIASNWFRVLMRIFGVRLEVEGVEKAYSCGLLVSNHISWMDIVVIFACLPVKFLSKREVRRWPVIGFLAASVGTFFIKRSSRRDLLSVNKRMSILMKEGGRIAAFPEGTTTVGKAVKPFHSSIFQSVIDAKGFVCPSAITYRYEDSLSTENVAYVDNISLIRSIDSVLVGPRLIARVKFLQPLKASGESRQSLASISERAVSDSLLDGS